jgi:hypothetical protein
MVTCQAQDCCAGPPKSRAMTEIPEGIVLRRHRDLHSPGFNRPVRYVLLVLTCAVIALGLANVFGQRPETLRATSPQASLEVYAPAAVRGGLLYEARLTVHATSDLKNALLQFSPGWNEGMQMNTIEPTPLAQASRDGDLLFTLGHVRAGTVYRLFLQFQVDPTNVGHRNADVSLYDGGTKLLTIHRTITVYP